MAHVCSVHSGLCSGGTTHPAGPMKMRPYGLSLGTRTPARLSVSSAMSQYSGEQHECGTLQLEAHSGAVSSDMSRQRRASLGVTA